MRHAAGGPLRVLVTYAASASHLAELGAAAPGAEIVMATNLDEARRGIAGAEVVLGNRFFLEVLPAAASLRWMQSGSVGVERILRDAGGRLRDVTLTSARGLYDEEIADHAVALFLALARDLHGIRDEQQRGEWRRRPLPQLAGRRVLVLGWGGVGRAVAVRLRAFKLEVEGVRRRQQGPMPEIRDGFAVWGPEGWRSRIAGALALILALPATKLTRGLVGARELAALGPAGLVVNVGRGATLDQAALLDLLRRGGLRGAALDVCEVEPPPADDPLWREPRLLLSPHVARSEEQPPFRWETLFVENLRRWAAGEALLNVVDQEAGY